MVIKYMYIYLYILIVCLFFLGLGGQKIAVVLGFNLLFIVSNAITAIFFVIVIYLFILYGFYYCVCVFFFVSSCFIYGLSTYLLFFTNELFGGFSNTFALPIFFDIFHNNIYYFIVIHIIVVLFLGFSPCVSFVFLQNVISNHVHIVAPVAVVFFFALERINIRMYN